MTGRVVIVGGGVIGLCAAFYCARRGWRVTVVERNGGERDGCSYGNTGMVVPSHFVPLAAPGMVALALRWMWNPASPFYVKPRVSWDLIDWGLKFWRAANAEHVRRAALCLRSRMEDELYGFRDQHEEPAHVRMCDRDRPALANLVHKSRDDAAVAAEDIAEADN